MVFSGESMFTVSLTSVCLPHESSAAAIAIGAKMPILMIFMLRGVDMFCAAKVLINAGVQPCSCAICAERTESNAFCD